MSVSIISAEINNSDIPKLKELFNKIKARSVKIEEKDPTEMTKEEFFAKIDRARTGKKIKMSREEMRNLLLSKAQ